MAISIGTVNSAFHNSRQQFLDMASKGLGPKGISVIVTVGVFALIYILLQLRKGREERKSIAGPLAILIFCVVLFFPVPITIYAYIAVGILSVILVKRLKDGEWKGVLPILVALIALSFIISVNIYMMVGIAGVGVLLAGRTHKENHDRTYGTSEAAHIAKEMGMPVRKERKIIRGLARIANRGYGWSKDKVVRSAALLKQRAARRSARNIEEQEHEAEIAAAGEKLAITVEDLEKNETSMQERDHGLIMQILKHCESLKRFLVGLNENAVDEQRQKEILDTSKVVLKRSNELVANKIQEESYREKANKVLEVCMSVIHDASNEAKELKDSRADFMEMKKAADHNIVAMKKEIDHNITQLNHARKTASKSSAQGAGNRIALLEQRQKALENVDNKLRQIESYIKRILKRLNNVNLAEDKRIAAVDALNDKAEKHKKRVEAFEKRFDDQDKALKKEHKRFEHLFKDESSGIPDEQLINVTDSTIEMFASLEKITLLAHDYNSKELGPLIGEMAEVAKNLMSLSKVSRYLSMMYFRLTQAMDQMTQMAEIVDQNAESKNRLKKILGTEELEQKIVKRSVRKGKAVVGHIKNAYGHLQTSYGYMQRHIAMLDREVKMLGSTKREVGGALNAAFKATLKTEIKQAKLLDKEASTTEADLRKAKLSEMKAKHAD